jgi:hypothetical protein
MSELNPTTLRRELMLQNAIEQRLDTLVSLATSAVLKLSRSTQMEESQLRNLLNASIESKSVEVITNFVRYQIARKERDWDTSPKGFGHTVIQHIVDDIKKTTDAVTLNVAEGLRASLQAKHSDMDIEQSETSASAARRAEVEADIAWFNEHRSYIHVRLMQLYLGYINRVFYFYKKSIDRDRREPQSNALNDALSSLELVSALATEVKTNG